MRKSILLLLFLFPVLLSAQQVPAQAQQQAQQEIQRRGLGEAEVRQRLLERGVNIDNMTPEQLLRAQPQIEAVVKELEAEKAQAAKAAAQDAGEKAVEKQAKEIANESAKEIEEAVKDGATVQEAIAEELIEESSEEKGRSRIYGQQLFRNKTLEVYRSVDNVKPPESYVLGSGDQVNISIFGVSQADLQFEIAEDGFIRPSNMPRIYLKGVTYGKAKELLKQRFRQAYLFQPEQFAVSLNTARTITVNIFGDVETQGSFTISAVNTAFNALVAAGGPTDIGSVRNIKLIRNGEERYLDVYEFMNNPSIQFDYALENNDIIFVPTAERVIDVQGAVKRPLRYELAAGEQLMELLAFTGGLNADAYTDLIQVKRFANNEQQLIDVPLLQLLQSNGNVELLNGDQVIIKTIPTVRKNTVQINGAVELPGEYALTEGLRVSDLIGKGVLKEDAKTDIAFLFRRNLDRTLETKVLDIAAIVATPGGAADLKLQKEDRILIFSQARYADTYEVVVSGAVREPNTLEYEPNLTVSGAIYLTGGLSDAATDFAYITRPDPGNPDNVEYIRVNIREALANPGSTSDVGLQPLDRLRILNKTTFTDDATVRVSGAVRSGGEFKYDASLNLQDALTLAGGLKLQAASNRIDVFRLIINDNEPTRTLMYTVEVDRNITTLDQVDGTFELQPFDQVVVRAVPEFEFQQSIILEGEVRYPGTYAMIDDNERLSSIIKRAGGLTREAYPSAAVLYRAEDNRGAVILDLEKALAQPGSNQDLVIKDGDVLTIPKPKELVAISVRGTEASEVYADSLLNNNGKINIAFDGKRSAKWYIKEYAAGFAKRANRKSTTVKYANGRYEGTNGFLFFRSYPEVKPGSEITIAMKPPKKRDIENREPVNWGKVATDIASAATTALTLILLIQRIE